MSCGGRLERGRADVGDPSDLHAPGQPMRFFVGTSGYSYKERKGGFYPEKLPQKDMLSYYARSFSTVEINNTFNTLPGDHVVESWVEQTPESFRFALKAPKSITHFRRFKDAVDVTDNLLHTASLLGS